MFKTIALVTSQHCSDRIILAARKIADLHNTELLILDISDSKYPLVPEAVDYLFGVSKKNNATMRMIFTKNMEDAMRDVIFGFENLNIVTGMPSSNDSVLYSVWKKFPEKNFFTVDADGQIIEVDSGKTSGCTA